MEKDIFCKIIAGEIPCYKIYEDADVLAFLDISQVTKGHALVVPKEHYDTFLSCPEKLMHKVMDVAQRIRLHFQFKAIVRFITRNNVHMEMFNCLSRDFIAVS